MKRTVLALFLSFVFLLPALQAADASQHKGKKAEFKGQACPLCEKRITRSSAVFTVVYEDGKKKTLGCPHCGLAEVKKGKVKRAMAMDFLRKKMIDAKSAWYLKGTEIGFCCEPYWLSFGSKEEAEKFSKGFGGKVLSYEEALKDLEGGEKAAEKKPAGS